MTEVAHSIDLDLPRKLREDPGYRRQFFLAESSAEIAEQLIAVRNRRRLTQAQVAHATGTKQPAISRAERADYQNHNLSTLRNIAQILEARVRVLIQPYEDVLTEYEEEKGTQSPVDTQIASLSRASQPIDSLSLLMHPQWAGHPATGVAWGLSTPFYNTFNYNPTLVIPMSDPERERLRQENAVLRQDLIQKQHIIENLNRQVMILLNLTQKMPTDIGWGGSLPKSEALVNNFQDQKSAAQSLP